MTLAALALDNPGVSRAAAEVGSTANSYQILAKLATGGMAEIFLARGEGVAGVERYCVLKRILRDRASDVHFVRMFLDEARLAAQLQHPNIAQVYDIGKLGDSYFFTMEYVHGETVRTLLHRAQGLRRTLPIGAILTIGAGTAAGLHHAHERLGLDGRPLGIVHRDVSPSNLMVSYEGGVKVVDFGVAKAADRGHETKSGTVKGKISYLSPEQCKGKRVDRRSDLFSLGICLWEMLTTERLFRRSSDFENMHAIVNEETPPPSSRRADVPREVDELLRRLLAKTPDARLQTADDVVEAIEQVASKTGSVLSTSALGKLMRELFGQRPEPWLELESQHEPGEAITVTSEPIPPELAAEPADKLNQQLASVIDLSVPRVATESLDSLGSLVSRSLQPAAPAGSPQARSPDAPGSPASPDRAAAPAPPASPDRAAAPASPASPDRAAAAAPPASRGVDSPDSPASHADAQLDSPGLRAAASRDSLGSRAAASLDSPGSRAAASLDSPGSRAAASLDSLGSRAAASLDSPGSRETAALDSPGSRAAASQDSPGARAAASLDSPGSRAAASLDSPGSRAAALDPPGSRGTPVSRGSAASTAAPALRARASFESLSLESVSLESVSLEPLPPEIPTTLGKRIPLGLPLAAPPPTDPGARDAAAAELPPALPPPPLPGRSQPVVLPEGARGVLPGPAPIAKHTPPMLPSLQLPTTATTVPDALDTFPAGPDAPAGPPPSRRVVPSEQQPIVRAPTPGPLPIVRVATPGPLPIVRVPPSGAQASALASSGHLPQMTSAGVAVVAADSHGSMRSSAPYRAPVERHGWPFYAVIGGAALVGSIAVMLVMRSGGEQTDATSASKPASLAVRPADNAAAPPSSASAITVVPIEPAADRATDAARGAAKPVTDEPAVDPSTAQTGTAQKATRPGRANASSRTAAPAALPAAPQPGKREHDDEINKSYAAGLYDKVVEQCGAGPVSAEHAPMCFLAACHAGNEARARKWIAAVPAARREQLITNCKQLGIDVKKADRQVDCEADPMACQH